MKTIDLPPNPNRRMELKERLARAHQERAAGRRQPSGTVVSIEKRGEGQNEQGAA